MRSRYQEKCDRGTKKSAIANPMKFVVIIRIQFVTDSGKRNQLHPMPEKQDFPMP
ncbi:hypothetical protein [Nostoc commune]|uniref:hypothetical protein n=1 Tax=Nostoc commune TaxID=1178 RepID=UPI0018C737A5|nr:hypothetical protein [Nostoc commune]